MKIFSGILATLLITFFTACGPGKTSIDSSVVSGAFGSASADLQGQISTVVSAVDSGDFEAAIQPLNAVITKGGLSDEQKSALTALLADMQRVVVENQEQYSMEVYNGLNDLVGALAGNAPINM